MANGDGWQLRIEGGLSAHFNQPDGTSRPGTDWAVDLVRAGQYYRVTVRAYLSDDLTNRARADSEYHAQTVFGYVSDLLAQGWTPDKGGELVITILNPQGEQPEPSKPWWKIW